MYYIVGIGNPKEEYEGTRHNIGRDVLDYFHVKNKFPSWEQSKKYNALISQETIDSEKVFLSKPLFFMNLSGKSVKECITSPKKAEQLIVIHDDLDLPLGTFKIAYNRGTAGHKGVESIKRAIKTKAFTRIRVGISAQTSTGKIKKPRGEEKINKFVLGTFSKKEKETIEKMLPEIERALTTIVLEGRAKAMNLFH